MEKEYRDKEELYFKNLPAWPTFDIFDKNIDGLIPSAHLESWEQFHEVVKTYRSDEEGSEYIFRGQHNFQWALQPTLNRMSSEAVQEDVARKQLRNFKLSIRGRVSDNAIFNEREEELWAIGQHHGLATPLLDWTMAPYVALFFAFMNEDPETWKDNQGEPTNHSRNIYILNKSFIEDLIEEEDSLDKNYPKIVEPSKDDHGRLVNQAGLFTLAPYGETIESSLLRALVDSDIDVDNPEEVSRYICKLHIPNSKEIRSDCLRHLRKMNIHHASLFPDLIGASGYCNELISELINKRQKILMPQAKEVAVEPTKVDMDALPLQKDFLVSETDTSLRALMLSLIVNDEIKSKISADDLRAVVKIALDFVGQKAGVDWYVRESQLSRLKIIIRRQLKSIHFPDDFIASATDALTLSVASMSQAEEDKKAKALSDYAADIKAFGEGPE